MSAFDFDTAVELRGRASMKWNRYGPDVLPMWVADMDFRTSPAILDALQAELDHGVFGYSMPTDDVADAVVGWAGRRYDWQIDPAWIVWFPGVVPGMSACCRMVGEAGDDVLACPPVYHHFLHVAAAANRSFVTAPLRVEQGRWTLDLEAIEAAITPRTRLLLLCSPHNPVGSCFQRDELAQLVALCVRHDVLICSDEIHCDLILDAGARHIPTATVGEAEVPGIITLMAPSKTFNLAGIYASYAIIPDEGLRKRFRKSLEEVLPLVTSMGFAALKAAYTGSDDWHAALIDYLRGNRDYLQTEIAAIDGLSMPHVSATYLGWIDTRGLPCDDAHSLFLNHGLGFSDGEQFGHSGFQRINFACPRSRLEEALDRIRTAVAAC